MKRKSSGVSWGNIRLLSFLLAASLVFLLAAWRLSDLRQGGEEEEESERDVAVVQRDEPREPEPQAGGGAGEPRPDGPTGEADGGAGEPRPDGPTGEADSQEGADADADADADDQAASLAGPIAPLVVYSPGAKELLPAVFGLPGHATEHYVIYSQLSEEATYDIAHRLEAMYDYYAERFSDVYYPIDFNKQVFLFNNRADFVAAGGHPTMPGQFMSGGDKVGARLMMIFNEGNIGAFMTSCPLMYHEGFHQFELIEISQAGNVNRMWPLWLDEGYATTFNNITWTGDGWVDGLIRIEYADSAVKSAPKFLQFKDLLSISGANWHRLTSQGKIWPVYMEGMSLIFFLNHADDGKYRPLLAKYVKQVSTGQDSSASAQRIMALQPKFIKWVKTHLNTHMTGAKYYEIFTAMATSHLARAHGRRQRFASGEDFLAKVKAKQLALPPMGDEQWLPKTLQEELLFYHNFLTKSYDPFEFEIEYPRDDGEPVIRVRQRRFGLELKGSFELEEKDKVADVSVEYVKCLSIDLTRAKAAVGAK